MNSICISIEANESQQELLIAQLSELGAEGFEQADDRLLAYFKPLQFPGNEIYKALEGFVFQQQELEEQNWNALWESNFPPVVVEDFCAVRADFHEPVAHVTHQINIMPKMSFGTGHHATTYMMIREMKDIDFRGKTVFDFGTGTGILAILAEHLGAVKVKAIDNDPWSIENAEENLQRNQCSKTELTLSTALPGESFDIILANINRNVILQNLSGLVKMLHRGGIILLSGLLFTDEADIMNACRLEGLNFIQKRERNSWIALKWKN